MGCAGGMPVGRRGSCDLSLNVSMAVNLKRRRTFGQVERVPLALLHWLKELRTERELLQGFWSAVPDYVNARRGDGRRAVAHRRSILHLCVAMHWCSVPYLGLMEHIWDAIPV